MGDSVLLTALCRDITLSYPGRFELVVNVAFRDIFVNFPYARVLQEGERVSGPGVKQITISYHRGILQTNRSHNPTIAHMLSWYHRDFAEKMKLELSPRYPKACLPLTAAEQVPLVNAKNYWVIVAGGKTDVPVKVWRPEYWQQLVNRMNEQGMTCVQVGAKHSGHFHPTLAGVVDMVGKLRNTRELFNVIANATGVVCPVTGAMHIAAAYDKPCVVIAGGREAPWWEGYTNQYQAFGPQSTPVAVEHRYLHTLGKLACCQDRGCWKHRVVQLNDMSRFDRPDKRCKLVKLNVRQEPGPACMDLISVDEVLQAVNSYQLPTKPTRIPELIRLPGFDTHKVEPMPIQHLPSIQPLQIQKANFECKAKIPNMANPLFGNRLSVFVLCYGPHADLARRCIDSILATVPAEYLDLRVGCNVVEDETLQYLSTVPHTKLYIKHENVKKYPLMREMFYDRDVQPPSNYIAWFDDDTKVVDHQWLQKMTNTILLNHSQGVRLYGKVFYHDIQKVSRNGPGINWFRQGTWWRNKGFFTQGRAVEAPNGSVIPFVAGWFWMADMQALKQAGVPDNRLQHNGGDITIGAQVYQHGFKLKTVNTNKELIWCPTRENGGRRGFSENFPWCARNLVTQ